MPIIYNKPALSVDQQFENPSIKKIITDVDPNNLRVINCYKKVGFKCIKESMTPDGLAFLMEITGA